MPRSIVIVGGSVAGLIHGLQLKREGNDVTILERDPRSLRSSHNAGIAYRAGMKEILEKYDDTGKASSIDSNRLHLNFRQHPSIFAKSVERPLKYELTSWGLLYRMLRANFDGFASVPYPQPPKPRPGDGKAVYLTGHHVTDLKVSDDKVTVHYTDATEKPGSLRADLVIGADGLHSTVRRIVQAPTVRDYSGFVAWRGTVPEKDLSELTAKFFINGFSFDMMNRTYILCYLIPTDEGGVEPGERLANWVWYMNVAEGSKEMNDIFTDRNGKLHSNTISQDLISVPVWEQIRATGAARMSAPFVELLSKTDRPFVTKVNDSLCTKARYWDDKVLLVGDALCTPRSNIAMSTEQAAADSLALNRALTGEISMEAWEQHVLQFAQGLSSLGKLVGNFGLGTWTAFARSIYGYIFGLLGQKRRGT